jgi:WD40 repeat protein
VVRVLAGYTLVEVIIFLAVSGALLVAASTLIVGRQDKVRFSQAVVEFEEKISDALNDASTGYFPSNSDFSCDIDASGRARLTSGSGNSEQGSNNECIFAGKLIHFRAETYTGSGYDLTDGAYKIYTLIGPRSATSIYDGPVGAFRLLGYDNEQGLKLPGVFEREVLSADLEFDARRGSIPVIDSATGERYFSLIIANDFNGGDLNGNGAGGSSSGPKLYGYKWWDHNGNIWNVQTYGGDRNILVPIEGKAVVCLARDGNGRPAALMITKQLTIERYIDNVPAECR